jgi:glycerophosphoryl diester phosphodiesterase
MVSSPMVEIIAHRGASFDAPENTLASVRLGWEQGADAVEIDVRLTQDGHVVAFHDDDTSRVSGCDGVLADLTLDELRRLDCGRWKAERFAGERAPTLREVLATVPDGKRLYVEVKCGPELRPALQADLGSVSSCVTLISLDDDTLREVKHALPHVPAYWVVPLERSPSGEVEPSADELISRSREAGFEGVDLGHTRHLDQAMMDSLLAAGLRVCVWTVNEPAEAARLIGLGVAGITTDRPGWLRERLTCPAEPRP